MSFQSLLVDAMDVLRNSTNQVSDGSWVLGTGWTQTLDSFAYTGASGVGTLSQAFTTKPGIRYQVRAVTAIDSGSPLLTGTLGGAALKIISSAGDYRAEVRAVDTSGIVFTGDGVGGNDITISAITVTELDSSGQAVRTQAVQFADVACRIDESTGKHINDEQYTEVSPLLVFTEQRGIDHEDVLRVKTLGGEAQTPFDLLVNGAAEIKGRKNFHHAEISVTRIRN